MYVLARGEKGSASRLRSHTLSLRSSGAVPHAPVTATFTGLVLVRVSGNLRSREDQQRPNRRHCQNDEHTLADPRTDNARNQQNNVSGSEEYTFPSHRRCIFKFVFVPADSLDIALHLSMRERGEEPGNTETLVEGCISDKFTQVCPQAL